MLNDGQARFTFLCQAVCDFSNPNDDVYLLLLQTSNIAPGSALLKSTYHMLSLNARSLPEDLERRAPIDIVVSMDISGSMSGNKLKLCKETTVALVNELDESDRFCLVVFGDESEEIISPQLCTKAAKILMTSKINGLSTRGCTNLSGGVISAIQSLQAIPSGDQNDVRSVLLLTDGHANRGVSSTDGIVSMLTGCLKDSPIGINVFGYGQDHNEDMLTKISEVKSGSYYFVKSADDVSSAFGDCIGGLMSVVAQNIKITITSDAVVKVFHEKVSTPNSGTYVVDIGDIFADEQKDVIVEVSLPTSASIGQISATIEYVDISKSALKTSPAAVVLVTRDAGVAETADTAVMVNVIRVKTADILKQAMEIAKGGNLEAARKLINDQIISIGVTTGGELSGKMSDIDTALITSLIADLNQALSGLSNHYEYEHVGSKVMRSKMQMYSLQRCNDYDVGNLYRGKKKGAMMKKLKENTSAAEAASPNLGDAKKKSSFTGRKDAKKDGGFFRKLSSGLLGGGGGGGGEDKK